MGDAGEGDGAGTAAAAAVGAAAGGEGGAAAGGAAAGGEGGAAAGGAEASPGVPIGNVPAPLSKNQQKKLLRAERNFERKKEKRAEEKANKRAENEKRRAESQAHFETLTEEERQKLKEEYASRKKERMAGDKGKKERLREQVKNGQSLVIDLEFGSLMTEGEIRSLMQQMMYCYAANNKSASPYRLCFTGINGNMAVGFDSIPGFKNWIVGDVSAGSYMDLFKERKGDLVYLTADSPNEIGSLDEDKVYIIGGLVDRNRHKNVTAVKAKEQGIATARLPITQHMKLSSSCVLTVNQVLDILLFYKELGGWKPALEKAIPPRKRAGGPGGSEDGGDGGGKEGGGGGKEGGSDGEPPAKAARVEGGGGDGM